jgi:hypothetical protein
MNSVSWFAIETGREKLAARPFDDAFERLDLD